MTTGSSPSKTLHKASGRARTPAGRLAISIAGAVAIHALVVAAAWPWIRPFVLPPAESAAQRMARKVTAAARGAAQFDGPPIIVGALAPGDSPDVADVDYESVPWQSTAFVAPADARLPFTAALSLRNRAGYGFDSSENRVMNGSVRSPIVMRRPTIRP